MNAWRQVKFPKTLAIQMTRDYPQISDVEEDPEVEDVNPDDDNDKDIKESAEKLDNFLATSQDSWRWYGHSTRRLEEYVSDDDWSSEEEEAEDPEVVREKLLSRTYRVQDYEDEVSKKESKKKMMAKRTGMSVGQERMARETPKNQDNRSEDTPVAPRKKKEPLRPKRKGKLSYM